MGLLCKILAPTQDLKFLTSHCCTLPLKCCPLPAGIALIMSNAQFPTTVSYKDESETSDSEPLIKELSLIYAIRHY